MGRSAKGIAGGIGRIRDAKGCGHEVRTIPFHIRERNRRGCGPTKTAGIKTVAGKGFCAHNRNVLSREPRWYYASCARVSPTARESKAAGDSARGTHRGATGVRLVAGAKERSYGGFIVK